MLGQIKHKDFHRLLQRFLRGLFPDSLFRAKGDWVELEKILGKRVPWQRGMGPDLILVRIEGLGVVDLTALRGEKHVLKLPTSRAAARTMGKDWKVIVAEDILWGKARDIGQVIDEQLIPILEKFGMSK